MGDFIGSRAHCEKGISLFEPANISDRGKNH